jgi:hypothetical protein
MRVCSNKQTYQIWLDSEMEVKICYKWNSHLRFILQAIELNTELRKILNVGNITLRLLTWKDLNRTLNLEKRYIEAHCD